MSELVNVADLRAEIETSGTQYITNELMLALVVDAERLNLIRDQIALYEMSYSDEMGLDPETTLICIANILETGHPAREESA